MAPNTAKLSPNTKPSLRKGCNSMTVLFRLCGGVAALSMGALFLMIASNVILRFFGLVIPGSTQYAGYLMAGTFFLGLPYAMHKNRHVAVDLLINRLSSKAKSTMAFISAVAALIACLVWAYFTFDMVIISFEFGDLSEGADATPLWIPQLLMAVGVSVLCIAIIEQLIEFKQRFRNVTNE